jgi:hypothetical protein
METSLIKRGKSIRTAALLLLGGAFVFGMTSWFLGSYRIVRVPVPAIPEGALARLTVFEESAAAKKLLSALDHQDAASFPLTMFISRGLNDGLWRSQTADVSPATQTKWTLVSRGHAGIGIFADGRLPIRLDLDNVRAKFTVGHEFVGVLKDAWQGFSIPKTMNSDPKITRIRLRMAHPNTAVGDFRRENNRVGNVFDDGFSDILGVLPHEAEIVLGLKSMDEVVQPFILMTSFPDWNKEARADLESAIRRYLGGLDPITDTVLLEDGTIQHELRDSSDKVSVEEKELSTGKLVHFYSHSRRHELVYFLQNDGLLHLSSRIEYLQQGIMATSGYADSDCGSISSYAVGHVFPDNAGFKAEIPFQSIKLSLENRETGLFTVCGYFR